MRRLKFLLHRHKTYRIVIRGIRELHKEGYHNQEACNRFMKYIMQEFHVVFTTKQFRNIRHETKKGE